MIKIRVCFFITALISLCINPVLSAKNMVYPKTRRINHVDIYHGIEVADPYRWLEQDVRQYTEVRKWVDAQNKLTFKYLKSLPQRRAFKKRLTELLDYEKYTTPFKAAGHYFISKNTGLQNHYVTYVMDSIEGKQRVLFNPNTWSKEGTAALSGMAFSNNGQFAAYGIQQSGSDWRTWKVRNINTGKDLPDVLHYLKFTGIAWDPESKGFFYAKYPDPDSGKEFQSLNQNMKVMYHCLGTQQRDDIVVFYRPDMPKWSYNVEVTDDGHYLVITASVGTDSKYRIIVKDLRQAYAMGTDIITEFKNDYTFIDNDGPIFYFRTDFNAPRGRVIAMDIRKPQPQNIQEIIAQRPEALRKVDLINNMFVCTYLKDVAAKVRIFSLDGRYIRDVDLPGLGTASGFTGKRTDIETFYSYQSYAAAPSVYRYDMVTGKSSLLKRDKVDFNGSDYITKQVFYRSKDGTRIPLFITHKRGLKNNSLNPTLLYGYGGFDISILPRFSASRIAWLEKGGIYAVANIRGGGEYGRKWHEAGKKKNKQNVFDDFIAGAEFLIQQKYTCSKKLAIMGRSNGGLLVGACMTQRPDLFGAAIPGVGVMDMLRFDEFTAGRFWVDDYGSAKTDKSMFEYLKGYSPYHNLRPGICYPAALVMTADTDDRVVPGHSFKFAARLQRVQSCKKPVLIRIETSAGHGSGKPTAMIIQEQADIYAFLADNLDM